MALCLQAWRDLATCRPIGMAVGPIPWTAAIQWCDRKGLDDGATEVVLSVLRRLDLDYADRENSKNSKGATK